jgi:hypothetical protein
MSQTGATRWALVPALVGTAGLVFRWRMAPLGLLVAVVMAKVLPIWFFWPSIPPRSGTLVANLVFCLALVTYIMAQYRVLALHVGVLPPDPSLPDAAALARDSNSVPTQEVLSALLVLVAASVGAVFLWEITALVRPPWGLTSRNWRVELLVWILGVGVIVLTSVIGYLSWGRQSKSEAMMVLRDEFWRQTRGEQRSTNRWRAWARRRQERVGPPIDS